MTRFGRSRGAVGEDGRHASRPERPARGARRAREVLRREPTESRPRTQNAGRGGRSRAGALKAAYTTGARDLAARSIEGLARTRVSPNALTAAGVTLCALAAVLVYFEYRDELVFFWLGAAVFVAGSVLDILDGALARRSGKGTPFGAFLDSTTDRAAEGFVLGAITLVFARDGNELAVGAAVAAVAGSFLVSYTRARAEALGLKGDVGIGSRAERVVVITAGLVLAPWGALPLAIYVLAATAWFTVLQRVLSVRAQLSDR